MSRFINPSASLGGIALEGGFLDGVEDLLDNLRVKRRVAMERNHHASALYEDPMTALDRNQTTQHLRESLRHPPPLGAAT